MAKIKVTLDHPIQNGETITFKAPCDCTGATDGLIVYYPYEDGSGTGNKTFVFADSHNNNVSSLGNLFAKNALVAVVVNIDNARAHILNADTNAYVESKLNTSTIVSESGKIYSNTGSERGTFSRWGNFVICSLKYYASDFEDYRITDDIDLPSSFSGENTTLAMTVTASDGTYASGSVSLLQFDSSGLGYVSIRVDQGSDATVYASFSYIAAD